MSVSIDRMLTNIEILPFLYEAIVRKQVLSIVYKPYNEEKRTLIFHPHFLKEYNGRWNLFGHAEGHSPENGYNIPLDRIQAKPCVRPGIEYIAAPPLFYEHFSRILSELAIQKIPQNMIWFYARIHIICIN